MEGFRLNPYKIQLVQELKPVDHRLRRAFVAWILQQLAAEQFSFSLYFNAQR